MHEWSYYFHGCQTINLRKTMTFNLHYNNICQKNPTYCLAIYYYQTIMMKIYIAMTLTLHMHACTTLYGLAGINQTCTLLQNNVL